MANDFNDLQFQIKAEDKASPVLNNVIKSLEKIQKMQSTTTGGTSTAQSQEIMIDGAKAQTNAERTLAKAINTRMSAELSLKNALDRANMVMSNEKASVEQVNIAVRNVAKAKKALANAEISEQAALERVTKEREKAKQKTEQQTNAQARNTNQTNKQRVATDKLSGALSKFAVKMGTAIMLARRLGRVVVSTIEETGSYVENLNLFAVTFGKTYEETAQWALDLAKDFGLASNEVIRFTGLFKQLSTAIGVAGETGTEMSVILTQLGYDFASFYNISTKSAMEKLQAGIFSGQTKPLRSIGLDITYQSIDQLLKTNEALARFNMTSKKLDQSQKAIARTILVMQNGEKAFGDMANTINTLQNQIRIFQGSISNLKLALGDIIQEPVRQALVYINGFMIAITDMLRAFKPITKKSTTGDNQIQNIGEDAEKSSEEMEELNGKLATFDKFNVLGGQQSGGAGSDEITKALQEELKRQQELYDERVKGMEEVTNQATEMAKTIREWFMVVDDEGNFIEWTVQAKALATIFTTITGIVSILGVGKALKIGAALKTSGESLHGIVKLVDMLKIGLTFLTKHPIVAIITAIAGLLVYMYTTNEQVRQSVQNLFGALAPLFALVSDMFKTIIEPFSELLGAVIENMIAPLATFIINDIALGLNSIMLVLSPISYVLEFIAKVLSTIVQLSTALFTWDWKGLGQDMKDLWENWNSTEYVKHSAKGFMTSLKGHNVFGFANGGYTNANLIMTNEQGKREWVGGQGNMSAIVNDKQMTDIMRQAVAQGVYDALYAQTQTSGSAEQPIDIYIDGDKIFNATRNVARRQGLDFARV